MSPSSLLPLFTPSLLHCRGGFRLLILRLVGRRLGSFLDDIERIATKDYEPSDNDVIRARLRTLGVQEYSFWVEQGMAALPPLITN